MNSIWHSEGIGIGFQLLPHILTFDRESIFRFFQDSANHDTKVEVGSDFVSKDFTFRRNKSLGLSSINQQQKSDVISKVGMERVSKSTSGKLFNMDCLSPASSLKLIAADKRTLRMLSGAFLISPKLCFLLMIWQVGSLSCYPHPHTIKLVLAKCATIEDVSWVLSPLHQRRWSRRERVYGV